MIVITLSLMQPLYSSSAGCSYLDCDLNFIGSVYLLHIHSKFEQTKLHAYNVVPLRNIYATFDWSVSGWFEGCCVVRRLSLFLHAWRHVRHCDTGKHILTPTT